jgi:hypothetical protein
MLLATPPATRGMVSFLWTDIARNLRLLLSRGGPHKCPNRNVAVYEHLWISAFKTIRAQTLNWRANYD